MSANRPELTDPRPPRRSGYMPRRNLRGWEYSVDGPVEHLVKAFAVHLEAAEASGCSPTTIKLYDGRYRRFLTFLKESGYQPPFSLELLSAPLVRRSALWLREHSHGAKGGTFAARQMVGTLKTASAWLADEGYLPDGVDPLARLRRPRTPDGARLPMTQEEVRTLISAATFTQMSTRDTAMIMLLLDTGMRIGGALSILREDIDFKEHRVLLRLKGGREHVLYFGSSDRRDGGRSTRALKRYVDERDELVLRWRDRARGDKAQGKLFLSFDGWPLTPKGFHQALKNLARQAGLDGVFPHRFRHTFATWYLVRHPGDETGLRGILGHLSNDMFRTYTHIAHEIIAQRAGRVALSEAWLADESTVQERRSGPILFKPTRERAEGQRRRPAPSVREGQERRRLPKPGTGSALEA